MPIAYLPFSTTEPRATPPNDYQSIPTNPREFGAGVAQAEQTLGAGIQHAGQVFGEMAADDQANQVIGGLNDINAKLRSLQGADRMDYYPKARQQMDDLVSKARGNLTTINQTLAFDRETRYLHAHAQREAGDLYDAALKDWGGRTNGVSADLALNGISKAAIAGDQATIDAHTHALIDARIKWFESQHGAADDATKADLAEKAKREALDLEVKSRLGVGDLEGAARVFHANASTLAQNPDFDVMSRQITAAGDKAAGHAAALQAWAGAGGGAPRPGGSVGPAQIGPVSPGQVSEAAKRAGIDPRLANATASIESNHGAAATNRISPSHQGVFQLGPEERAAAGGSRESVGSLDDQVRQGVETLAKVKQDLTASLGREPTNAEVYLAHQQGVSGATKLLANPNTPAGQVVPPINISNNGGDPNAPASQFTSMWQQKYASREAQFATEGARGDQYQGQPIAGAQLTGAGGMPPSLAHAPTQEEVIGRIPEGLSEGAYARAYTELNQLYTHWKQSTSSTRAQLKQSIRNGIPMLEDGRPFSYDEAQIRSLLPPDEADQAIDLLKDAEAVGQQKSAVRGMSLSDATAQSAANHAQLAKAPPGEYIKMRRMADAFDKASDQHFKALFADPVGYLTGVNPEIQKAQQAVAAETPDQAAAARVAGQPTAFEGYASKLLEEQARLQVPAALTHVISTSAAPGIVQSLMADPSQAPQKMREMQSTYGSAWPAVWNDLVTVGKMPTAFQATGIIDPHMAMRLAQGLADEKGNETKKGNQVWEGLFGSAAVTGASGVIQSTRTAPGMADFLASMRTSGATVPAMDSFLHAVNTTAFALMAHEGLTQADAVEKAATAFTSLYGYMPNGGARVPIDRFGGVSKAAQGMVDTLSTDFVRVPAGFGDHPGAPTPADYIAAIQGNPTWINSGEGMDLIDNAGRRVIARDGKPVRIDFNAVPSVPAPAAGVIEPSGNRPSPY